VAVPNPAQKDECIAVVQVVNKTAKDSSEVDYFEDGDAHMLIVYGRLVGSVMSHVSKISEMNDSSASMVKLLDVAMAVISNLQPQSLYHNVATLAGHLVPCEWSTLYLADDSSAKVLYQVLKAAFRCRLSPWACHFCSRSAWQPQS